MQKCKACGREVQGKKYCNRKCSEDYWNRERSTGAGGSWHRVSNVDADTMTGDCTQCGSGVPVISGGATLRPDGSRKFRCRALVHSNFRAKKECDWRKRGILNFSYQDYEALLQKQKDRCAICWCQPTRTLHVDHDHSTGEVRGLLCDNCNTGIGKFKDRPDLLRAAIDYLGS